MSYLFQITGNSVVPDPAIIVIPVFAKIWDRNKDKSKSLKELAYCEFMASAQRSNPFSGYPEDSRSDIIISSLFEGKWKPDNDIQDAIRFIKQIQTEGSSTYSYYVAARISAEGMRDFFLTVDLSERNDKGMPVYKPKDITSALLDTEKVIQNLAGLQKKVEEELYESVKVRSGKTVSPFADPSSLKSL